MTLHLPFEVATQKSYLIPLSVPAIWITFKGTPWGEDFYDWLGGSNRTDALALAWLKCKLETSKLSGPGESDSKGLRWSARCRARLPTGIEILELRFTPQPSCQK